MIVSIRTASFLEPYCTDVPCPAQVQNVWFETLSMFMLCANAVAIGVQTVDWLLLSTFFLKPKGSWTSQQGRPSAREASTNQWMVKSNHNFPPVMPKFFSNLYTIFPSIMIIRYRSSMKFLCLDAHVGDILIFQQKIIQISCFEFWCLRLDVFPPFSGVSIRTIWPWTSYPHPLWVCAPSTSGASVFSRHGV